MSGGDWVSIIAVSGALVLAVSALRGHRVAASKLLVMALAWIAIFLLVAGVFSVVGAKPSSHGAS